MKYMYIDISGMICAGCSNAIKAKLVQLVGVRDASVDQIAGSAIVTYDPRLLSHYQVMATIEKLGYGAKASQLFSPGSPQPGNKQENSG